MNSVTIPSKRNNNKCSRNFESAADLGISYTKLNESQNDTCTYLMSIQMTKDMNEHLKGVIVMAQV